MRHPARTDRKWLYWLARRLYARRTATPPGAEGASKVLVVRVDERVGNLVMLQSLLDALRASLPDAHLGLLTSARADQVTRTLVGVDRLHQIDKRWFFRRPLSWQRVVGQVRRQGYQVAIDASAWQEFSYTHAALAWSAGAPTTVGYRRSFDSGFHTVRVEPGPPDEYELAQRMRLLAPLGIHGEPPVLRTTLGVDQVAGWDRWLEEHPVTGLRVGIWPGSRKTERRWPVEYYLRLGRRMQQAADVGLVVLWGPGEERLRDELVLKSDHAVAAPPTRLAELAGLLRRLDLFITNDTGPMHLAVAAGVPTVTLFASGDPRRWGHPYAHVRNLEAPGLDPEEIERASQRCLELLYPQR